MSVCGLRPRAVRATPVVLPTTPRVLSTVETRGNRVSLRSQPVTQLTTALCSTHTLSLATLFTAASSRRHPRTTRGYPRPGGNVTKKGRGYPRDPYVPDPPTVISPAAGDIPGRVGDIPGRSGISPAASRGCPRRAGTSPAFGAGHPRPARGCSRPFGGCPARVLVVGAAHATHMCVSHHALKSQNRLNGM